MFFRHRRADRGHQSVVFFRRKIYDACVVNFSSEENTLNSDDPRTLIHLTTHDTHDTTTR